MSIQAGSGSRVFIVIHVVDFISDHALVHFDLEGVDK